METSASSKQKTRQKMHSPKGKIKARSETVQKALLLCGIISSVWYIGMNLFVPLYFPGYNSASRVISELSAVGSPTRQLWNLLGIPYTLLFIAFSWGVWNAAGTNRPLRVAGKLLIAYSLLGLLWPVAPMHLRESLEAGGATWTDTMHIALGAASEVFFLLSLGFAATAFGKGFRI